jgi:hypothetical protein
MQPTANLSDGTPAMAVGPTKTIALDQIGGWLWLAGPLLVLIASAALRPGPDRQVLMPFSDTALPASCRMYVWLGVDCPGCGLTRSFVNMAEGQWRQAASVQPVGILLFLFTLCQIPLAAVYIYRMRSNTKDLPNRMWSRCVGWNNYALIGLMVALGLQWIIRTLMPLIA